MKSGYGGFYKKVYDELSQSRRELRGVPLDVSKERRVR